MGAGLWLDLALGLVLAAVLALIYRVRTTLVASAFQPAPPDVSPSGGTPSALRGARAWCWCRTCRRCSAGGGTARMDRSGRGEPPAGQLFHPATWGDWLAREGKPGLRPFVGSDRRRVPRRVWSDYLAVAAARGDWQRLLERYRVEAVVVDREAQPALARALRASPDWRRVHHDPRALVFAAIGRDSPAGGS